MKIRGVNTFFLYSVKIGYYLRWMLQVRQGVNYRHAGMPGKLIYSLLVIGSDHNAVKIRRQDPCGVGYGFISAKLRVLWVKVNGICTKVADPYLKRYSRSG